MSSISNVLPPNRIVGQNSYIEVQDANGVLYQLIAKSDNGGGVIWKRDGVEISAPMRRVVSAKTAAYTCLESECGTLFTTEGAGASVTFTLPTADADNIGLWYEFFCAEDFAIVVGCATADTLIVFNDVAADSISYATAGEMIGNSIKATSDGAKWIIQPQIAAEAVTVTIVTA